MNPVFVYWWILPSSMKQLAFGWFFLKRLKSWYFKGKFSAEISMHCQVCKQFMHLQKAQFMKVDFRNMHIKYLEKRQLPRHTQSSIGLDKQNFWV